MRRAKCRTRHLDGSTGERRFPERPARDNPADGFTDLSDCPTRTNLPGAELEFEGDGFETEDQRHWIDASPDLFDSAVAAQACVSPRGNPGIRQQVTSDSRHAGQPPGPCPSPDRRQTGSTASPTPLAFVPEIDWEWLPWPAVDPTEVQRDCPDSGWATPVWDLRLSDPNGRSGFKSRPVMLGTRRPGTRVPTSPLAPGRPARGGAHAGADEGGSRAASSCAMGERSTSHRF